MRGMRRIALLLSVSLCSLSIYAMPNPASVHCVKHGHHLKMIKDVGYCVFRDGSYCEEWQYLRGECKPGKHYWKRLRK